MDFQVIKMRIETNDHEHIKRLAHESCRTIQDQYRYAVKAYLRKLQAAKPAHTDSPGS
jgi:hypothetical protein